jgi:DNA repair exonuclease SbcCD ATPase subunit
MNRIVEIRKKMSSCKKKTDELEKQKNELAPFSSDDLPAFDIQKVKIEIANKKGSVSVLQQAITTLEIRIDEIKNVEQNSDVVDNLNSEIKSFEQKMESTQKKLDKVQRLRNGFENILKHSRKDILKEINPKIQKSINLLRGLGIDDATIKYKLNVTETKFGTAIYNHVVERFGSPMQFKSLSTGQRAICAIAMILSVFEVSYHRLGLLIFDELHTSGIDSPAMEKLLKMIVNLSAKLKIIFIDRRIDIIEKIKKKSSEIGVNVAHYNVETVTGTSMIRKS